MCDMNYKFYSQYLEYQYLVYAKKRIHFLVASRKKMSSSSPYCS